MKGINGAAVLAAALVAMACQDGTHVPSPTAPRADVQAAGLWAGQEVGETGPGSTYGLFLPNNWNGRLVVYAHGYTSPFDPVALPAIDALRDALGGQGFAVAYSSFSSNGYDVKDGAQRTHQLSGLFTSRFSKPSKTYLMGSSMGGLIALMLAEKYPKQYDGALPMCGVVGGSSAEIQYMGHVRAMWDYFYPNVLAGNIQGIPVVNGFVADVQTPVVNAIVGNPANAMAVASIAQSPVPWANFGELIQSFVTVFGFQYMGAAELTDRVHGHVDFDNRTTTYIGALPPALLAAINTNVIRWDIDPSAANYLQHYYQPTGDLEIPVLTMHTSRDPVVPIFHEDLLTQTVASAGASNLLVQRRFTRYGHCNFTGTEIVTGLGQLVGWVEAGVKPAP
jgi:pimeloyl-ACP methyl ester carboxylesterase